MLAVMMMMTLVVIAVVMVMEMVMSRKRMFQFFDDGYHSDDSVYTKKKVKRCAEKYTLTFKQLPGEYL